MKDLTQIETALFEREVKSLNAEISKGLDIIVGAFKKYANSTSSAGQPSISMPKSDSWKELEEYVRGLHAIKGYYYSGYHLGRASNPVDPDPSKVPEWLRELILNKAVSEFMQQVDSVDEIRNIAESAYHQSNQ